MVESPYALLVHRIYSTGRSVFSLSEASRLGMLLHHMRPLSIFYSRILFSMAQYVVPAPFFFQYFQGCDTKPRRYIYLLPEELIINKQNPTSRA